MINYPVGDFLTRVKNASLSRRRTVVAPKTAMVIEVAEVLEGLGFLSEVKEKKENLEVRLSYIKKEPVLLGLKLVSRPGLRIYQGANELARHKGASQFVVSTPKGIFSSKEAVKKRVGGEVVVEVW